MTPKSMTLSKLKQSELKRFDKKFSLGINEYSPFWSEDIKKHLLSAIEKAYNKGQIYGVDVGSKVGYDLREKEILAGIDKLFPYSFMNDLGDHAETQRAVPEETYQRRITQEEERILNMIINSIKTK